MKSPNDRCFKKISFNGGTIPCGKKRRTHKTFAPNHEFFESNIIAAIIEETDQEWIKRRRATPDEIHCCMPPSIRRFLLNHLKDTVGDLV